MESLPLVSVIVVSYNHAKYIKECLDSIGNQSYKKIELIVADDASSDESASVFEEWLSEYNFTAKKFFHPINLGLANTLNECIDVARGKYIKLVAADDFLHSRCLEECVDFLESKDESYGMVYSDTFAIDNDSNIIADIADYNELGSVDSNTFRKELLKYNRIAALTVLIKRDVLLETGKYDAFLIVEDYYRWLKIADKYNIGYIPSKLAYYRQHENNISKNKKERIEQESILISMMFDKTGYNSENINGFLLNRVLNKEPLLDALKKQYKHYAFKKTIVSLALTFSDTFYFLNNASRILKKKKV